MEETCRETSAESRMRHARRNFRKTLIWTSWPASGHRVLKTRQATERPVLRRKEFTYTDTVNAKADLHASGADLANVDSALSVSAADKVTADAPYADKVAVTIKRTNGHFTGKFTPTSATKAVSFTGVLQQAENRGAGLFRGESQTGVVEFDPR